MNLVIDIGNSRVKTGIFNSAKLLKGSSYDDFDVNTLKSIIKDNPKVKNAIICTVKKYPAEWKKLLKTHYTLVEMSSKLYLPVTIAYKTPETLGMDRLASVCGAYALNENTNTLVINAGTCITYDFLDNKGVYQGGSISPGVDIRFKALNTFTGQLPLLKLDLKMKKLTGSSTYEAMQAGVQQGIIHEVEGIIKTYSKKYAKLSVIITGGSMPWMLKCLKIKIKAQPFLVLQGLNVILQTFVKS